VWWNGRHERFKISCSQGRAGSSPATGTKKEIFTVMVKVSFLSVASDNPLYEFAKLDLQTAD
jgi:hypothetical protein